MTDPHPGFVALGSGATNGSLGSVSQRLASIERKIDAITPLLMKVLDQEQEIRRALGVGTEE